MAFFVEWIVVGFYWPLYLAYLFFSIAILVIIHNHVHNPIWKNRGLNQLTDHILSIFYGFPVFGWIPTHVKNHYLHVNKEPDYTKTYWLSERNNLLTLLSYPSVSGLCQNKAIYKFVKEMYHTNRKKFYTYIAQIVTLVVWIGVAFFLDWQKALVFVIIPQQVSLFCILAFNYVQHIHADEESVQSFEKFHRLSQFFSFQQWPAYHSPSVPQIALEQAASQV